MSLLPGLIPFENRYPIMSNDIPLNLWYKLQITFWFGRDDRQITVQTSVVDTPMIAAHVFTNPVDRQVQQVLAVHDSILHLRYAAASIRPLITAYIERISKETPSWEDQALKARIHFDKLVDELMEPFVAVIPDHHRIIRPLQLTGPNNLRHFYAVTVDCTPWANPFADPIDPDSGDNASQPNPRRRRNAFCASDADPNVEWHLFKASLAAVDSQEVFADEARDPPTREDRRRARQERRRRCVQQAVLRIRSLFNRRVARPAGNSEIAYL